MFSMFIGGISIVVYSEVIWSEPQLGLGLGLVPPPAGRPLFSIL